MSKPAYGYNAIDNIASRTDNSVLTNYAYTDAAHKHAATQMGSNAYAYDANGNMTYRAENGGTYFQTWDPENRLSAVISDTMSIHTANDGDGQRVRKTEYALQTPLLIDTFDSANLTTPPSRARAQSARKSPRSAVQCDPNCILA